MASLLLVGCGPSKEKQRHFDGAEVVGQPGRQPGQFSKPRAVAVRQNGELVVVDRSGRIQVYDLEDGTFLRQWRLAEWENGTPTGMTIDPNDDSIWLADTHYSRILNYDGDGNLLASWGENGEEAGQMIFPTDIAIDPDGSTVWVTEYGRRNRVMEFTRTGEFIKEWGSVLYDNDLLGRPMAIEITPDAQRLVVVDAGNHKVRIYSRSGEELLTFGTLGGAWGEMKYPLDLALGPDNFLYIVEYENSRISRYTLDGKFLDSWGEPGTRAGQMFLPWGCAVAQDGTLVIADTNNQRLQVVRDPAERFLATDPDPNRRITASVESAGVPQ